MIDNAANYMKDGNYVACEKICGVNDNMVKAHYHDFFEIYYLDKGARNHVIYNKLYNIKAGELVIFAPYVMHYSYGDIDIPFDRTVLYFRPSKIMSESLLEHLKNGTGVYNLDDKLKSKIKDTLSLILNEQENNNKYNKEYMSLLLNQLLIEIVRHVENPIKAEKKERFSEVITYLHEHYQEDIKLDDIAKHFFISPYYLCREFKKYTNTTIVTYLNTIRIMYAQRKLIESKIPITDISQQSGFANVTHFNRVFKKITGFSPSEYRKSTLSRY